MFFPNFMNTASSPHCASVNTIHKPKAGKREYNARKKRFKIPLPKWANGRRASSDKEIGSFGEWLGAITRGIHDSQMEMAMLKF